MYYEMPLKNGRMQFAPTSKFAKQILYYSLFIIHYSLSMRFPAPTFLGNFFDALWVDVGIDPYNICICSFFFYLLGSPRSATPTLFAIKLGGQGRPPLQCLHFVIVIILKGRKWIPPIHLYNSFKLYV